MHTFLWLLRYGASVAPYVPPEIAWHAAGRTQQCRKTVAAYAILLAMHPHCAPGSCCFNVDARRQHTVTVDGVRSRTVIQFLQMAVPSGRGSKRLETKPQAANIPRAAAAAAARRERVCLLLHNNGVLQLAIIALQPGLHAAHPESPQYIMRDQGAVGQRHAKQQRTIPD